MAYVQHSRNILRRVQNSERVLHHPLFHSAQGVRYRKLEIILTTSVDKLGKAGETVKVAPGYFRNYLMPKLYAVPSIEKYRHLVADRLKIYQPKEEEDQEVKVVTKTEDVQMKEYQAAVKRLVSSKLVFRKFFKVDKQIREPVTKEQIIAQAARQLFVQLSPENVHLKAPLSSFGEFEVPLRVPKSIPPPEGKSQWTLKVKIRSR